MAANTLKNKGTGGQSINRDKMSQKPIGTTQRGRDTDKFSTPAQQRPTTGTKIKTS